jgi:hypothetical protein
MMAAPKTFRKHRGFPHGLIFGLMTLVYSSSPEFCMLHRSQQTFRRGHELIAT